MEVRFGADSTHERPARIVDGFMFEPSRIFGEAFLAFRTFVWLFA